VAVDLCLAICRACPVLDDCARWVIEQDDEFADLVVGGMTYSERLEVRSTGYRTERLW